MKPPISSSVALTACGSVHLQRSQPRVARLQLRLRADHQRLTGPAARWREPTSASG